MSEVRRTQCLFQLRIVADSQAGFIDALEEVVREIAKDRLADKFFDTKIPVPKKAGVNSATWTWAIDCARLPGWVKNTDEVDERIWQSVWQCVEIVELPVEPAAETTYTSE